MGVLLLAHQENQVAIMFPDYACISCGHLGSDECKGCISRNKYEPEGYVEMIKRHIAVQDYLFSIRNECGEVQIFDNKEEMES
jgi:hypothetical protein